MSKFNLEEQYQLYLKKMNLKESEMPEVQRVETKRTFYGASGIILMLLTNDLAELPDNEAMKHLDDMIKQVGNFLLNETHKQN